MDVKYSCVLHEKRKACVMPIVCWRAFDVLKKCFVVFSGMP